MPEVGVRDSATAVVRARFVRFAVFAFILFNSSLCSRCVPAAEFRAGFDDPNTSWQIEHNKSRVRLLAHQRTGHVSFGGKACEQFELDTVAKDQFVRIEHQLPPARVIDDLKLSLRVRSNVNGATLALRVILPHQQDPRTRDVLSTLVYGDVYTQTGTWQELQCATPAKTIRDQLMRLRYQLRDPQIDTRDLYVDRAILIAPLAEGKSSFFLDELEFGPLVAPRSGQTIVPVQGEENKASPPVEFHLDRLLIEGRPFFPRFIPYHSEDLDGLKQTELNVLWLRGIDDVRLLTELRKHGLWAAATPPRAVSSQGEVLDVKNASLMPFSDKTAPVLFWYIGTQVPPHARADLIAWNKQVRNADHQFNRPVMADVTGDERVFSRYVSMLGISRHVINTSFPLSRYRDYLTRKRMTARPGTFTWTWIQTEAISANAAARQEGKQKPIVLEPEQIRLQVYAALSAGCRGIGYFKRTSLDAHVAGAIERRLAVTLLNLEMELLQPWLATGTVAEHVSFSVAPPEIQQVSRARLDFSSSREEQRKRDTRLRARDDRLRSEHEQTSGKLEAAIIHSDYGKLLLPVWYGPGAEFVPGQLAARQATIVVPGVGESDLAWAVTTTGIRNLNCERVAGGLKITLEKFDQTAAVIISPDQTLGAKLHGKVAGMAQKSARGWIDLARAKQHRVRRVNDELRQLGATQADAPRLLARTQALIESAEAAYERSDYDTARQDSAGAMQSLRILQRAHWDDAVRHLSSPVSSPHTICFQTLPDHWRMIARIGRVPVETESNLLRSGDFEDIDTMVVEGWKHKQHRQEKIRAAAELVPQSRPNSQKGKYCLRLVAVPATGTDPPAIVEHSPVQVATPPLTVHSGQVVHVSGWVQVAAPPVGRLDGAMIYDSLTGPAGALRWQEKTAWQPFQLIREVRKSGPFTVTFALNGLGELQLDDVRVVPLNLPAEPGSPASPATSADESQKQPKPLGFFNRLPKLNPLAPKKKK